MKLYKSPKIMLRMFPLLIMMIFILQVTAVLSVGAQQKATRQSSLEAYSKGDYEQAYREFRELLVTYPRDPFYKYYSGVCLIKMNRNPEEALVLLQQAQQGSSVVRTVPSDALFWLGRAQQMSGMFSDAVSSYNEFTEQNGKKAARDLDIPAYIQQCNDRKGQITEPIPETVTAEKEDVKLEVPINKIEEPLIDDKQITEKNDNVKDTIPGNFDITLSDALDYQHKADSLTGIAEVWKGNLEKLSYNEKTELRARITETENLAASYQKKADAKYNEAQIAMNSTSFAKVSKDTLVSESNVKQPEEKQRIDTVIIQEQKKEIAPQSIKSAELFSIFEANQAALDSGEKILVNGTIPPGLIYRIQIAVFRNPVARSYFNGISPIYGFSVPGTDKTAYYAGMFRRLADARKALLTVKQKGFKDAFIVALSGGKNVSMDRAVILEKEWTKKPFVVAQQARQVPADTIPPTLCFRVEVIRSSKPVKAEVLEGMKKNAGNRGLDIESLSDGTIVYLVGRFITYDSALEYTDLLIRNGYRDAKVVARLGKKEVPVETARQLFENLE